MERVLGLFCGYLLFISLGMACLWELFGFALAYSLDGFLLLRQYPHYFPFCLACGFIAFIGFIFVLIINAKVSKKIVISKGNWISMFIFAVLISIPIAKWWLNLFLILQYEF